jgi:Ca2+/Na+ antiporter
MKSQYSSDVDMFVNLSTLVGIVIILTLTEITGPFNPFTITMLAACYLYVVFCFFNLKIKSTITIIERDKRKNREVKPIYK